MPILEVPFDPKASPLAQTIDELIRCGWTAIPVVPRDKAPGEFRGTLETGSWTLMNAWNDYAHSKPAPAMIERWKTWPDANVGIVLGGDHLGYAVCAIDLDTDDDDELELLQSALPPSPMRKAGSRGYTAFYRCDKSVKTKRYMVPDSTPEKPNKQRTVLEILTGNAPRQTVMPPSMHPHGRPYVYTTGNGVVPTVRLPVLTQDHFDVLEDNLGHIGWRGDVVERVDRATRGAAQDDDNIWRETNTLALDSLDMWVGALGLPKIKRHGNGSWEAIPSFRPSNSGTDLMQRKSNLKFHRSGIKDMGIDQGHTPIDVVMAAFSWDFDSSFQWLRSKIGLQNEDDDFFALPLPPLNLVEAEDGTLSDASTGEVVWHSGNPVPPDGNAEPAATPAAAAPEPTESFIVDHLAASNVTDLDAGKVVPPPVDRPAVVDNVAIDSMELPDHLTRPPGLLGELTDFITETASTPNRVLSFASALVLMGTILGRKIATPTHSGTHLYVLALGATGSGKQHPLTMMSKVLTDIGCGALIGSSEAMSQTALINQLKKQPLSCSGIDEFGSYLKRINARNAGPHDIGIKKVMLSAWGYSFQPMSTPSWANNASTVIYSPCFSMLGMSTPESFYQALDNADVENGLLNRFLVLKSDVIARIAPSARMDRTLPMNLKANLTALYKIHEGPLEDPDKTNSEVDYQPIPLAWAEDGSMDEYYRFANEVNDLRNCKSKAHLSPYFGRTAEMALRIATIQAMGREPEEGTITRADMDYGIEIAKWSAYSMARQAALYMSESAHQSEVNKIIDIFQQRGGRCDHGTLLRSLRHRLKVKDVKDIIAGLLEAGTITKGNLPKNSGGSANTIYILQE